MPARLGGFREAVKATKTNFLALALAVGAAASFAPGLARAVEPPAEIVAIHIRGNEHVREGDIRGVMTLKSSSFLRGGAFDAGLLNDDLELIHSLYLERGYLEARVTGRAEVVNERTLPHQVAVVIEVVEGSPTTVASIAFEGNHAFPDARLRDVVKLRPQAPYDTLQVEPDLFLVESLYLDEGYLKARVEPRIVAGPGTRAITYHIEEGAQFRVGGLRVEGNHATREAVVLREITLKPGELFRRREVLESEQNIYNTGLFSRVTIAPAPVAGEEDRLDVAVRVTERASRWVSAGVGYGTIDELRLSGEWGNRNTLGTARTVSASALFATGLFPRETKRVRLALSFTEPHIVGPRSALTLTPFLERSIQPYLVANVQVGQYRLGAAGITATLRRDFSKRTRLWVGANQSWLRLRDATFTPSPADLATLGFNSDHRGQESSVTFGFERDTRDDFLDPRRGWLVHTEAKLAAARPLGLDKPFLKLTLTSGRHVPMGHESVLTMRLNAGSVLAVDPNAPIPDLERFKIGGETTLRGYPDQALGPANEMFTGSLEGLLPFPGEPRGLVFLDGGGVWGSRADIHLGDLVNFGGRGAVRYTAGAGLWIPTPVGPLRIGWGQRIGYAPRFDNGGAFVVFGQVF